MKSIGGWWGRLFAVWGLEEYSSIGEEHCIRCYAVIYPFSSRIAQSDQQKYCVRCAEELDAKYILKNSCSVCGKLMSKKDVKYVLPSTAFGRMGMPLQNRLACVPCYKKLQKKVRITIVPGADTSFRDRIRKQLTGQLMKKKVLSLE